MKDDQVWPDSLSILCVGWLKESGEIHFQNNIIKPIQKAITLYFIESIFSNVEIIKDDNTIIRDISYINIKYHYISVDVVFIRLVNYQMKSKMNLYIKQSSFIMHEWSKLIDLLKMNYIQCQ